MITPSVNTLELLSGIVYSEFDNHVGPVIRFSYPETILTKEDIEIVSEYIVLEKHLCNEVILINHEKLQFLLICMNIDNKKYFRNSFTFSFAFVLSNQSLQQNDIDVKCYHRILKSLTTFFYDLELESEFLSQSSTKPKAFDILALVYENLKIGHSCFLSIENTMNTKESISSSVMNIIPTINHFYLPLQLFKTPNLEQSINDFDVPMFKIDKIHLSHLSYDISFRHIILYIDGISHVKKISKDINMDIHFLKKTLSLLLYYNIIILADIFKFSNIYCFNFDVLNSQNLHGNSVVLNNKLLDEIRDFSCQEFVHQVNHLTPNSNQSTSDLPSNLDILLFLFKLQPKKSVGQLLVEMLQPIENEENLNAATQISSPMGSNTDLYNTVSDRSDDAVNRPQSDFQRQGESSPGNTVKQCLLPLRNINLQRLLAISLYKGLIRRLYEYPIYLKPANSLSNSMEMAMYNNLDNSMHGVSAAGVEEENRIGKHNDDDMRVGDQMSNSHTPASKGVRKSGLNSPPLNCFEPRQFSKMSKGKSVLSQHYLKEQGSHQDISEVIFSLDGTEHLDAICCKYELSYNEIVGNRGIQIIYK